MKDQLKARIADDRRHEAKNAIVKAAQAQAMADPSSISLGLSLALISHAAAELSYELATKE